MPTELFIIDIFCRVDNVIGHFPKYSQAKLHPSELVTLALLFVLKSSGQRAFCRWLSRDWKMLFPNLPERTRLFPLFVTHQDWTFAFWCEMRNGQVDTRLPSLSL